MTINNKKRLGKLLALVCLAACLIYFIPLTLFAETEQGDTVHTPSHIPSVEVTEAQMPDIKLSSDTYSATLGFMSQAKWFVLIIVLIGVILAYREPNPLRLHTVLHTNRKDKKVFKEAVKSGKRIPISAKDAEVIALMYGLADNKYLLLISGIMDLLTRNLYSVRFISPSEGANPEPYIEKANELVRNKNTLRSDILLCDLLGEGGYIKQLCNGLMQDAQDTYAVDEFIDAYIKESMSSLSKKAKFFWKLRIHGVDVYYTDEGSRQMLRDIRRFIAYMESYGIEGLESSTTDTMLVDFGRMIVFLGLNYEAISSETLRNTLRICGIIRDEVLSAELSA